ncbi:hypothetical protein BV22DRAFT_233957 [Leucogyrophana mollusca]|uniref:Uncharacterized protein n=1 Tax=Leucogyrophana mollusca TaxID=85980 RepID=A0ACB8BQR3_9AGAM|nr:hypothetical protein BV22DRAFT_233957 [Leucogyrophana mollusca]
MSTSASDNVVGITIACNADRHHRGVFETTIIKPSHKIYELGVVCPLYNKVGLPLVMYRHLSEDPLNMCRDPGLDNQIATFLMIEPSNGFAKAE